MKKFIFITLLIIGITKSFAQEIPSAIITDINGKKVEFQDIIKSDKPVIVSFWATWCVPCVNELDAISEVYPDWQDETGVKLIAISVDDDRTARRIKPLVNGKAWDYEIYRDFNNELRRAFNIASVPFMIIIKNGKIVYSHSGYSAGGEDKIYEIISKK